MSVSKSSVQQRGVFICSRNYRTAPQWYTFQNGSKLFFPWNPCRWLHFPCLVDGNFSALLPVSIMVRFPPKTLRSPVSCVVTINAHFLSCFKPETTSFVLFFASPAAPPAFLPEIVFLLCISQTWAGSSVHSVIPHYTVISPVSVSEVVSGVLSTHRTPLVLSIIFRSCFILFMPHLDHRSQYFIKIHLSKLQGTPEQL